MAKRKKSSTSGSKASASAQPRQTAYEGKEGHVFGKKRPSEDNGMGVHLQHSQEQRDTHFRPVPPPPGTAPYRLDISDVLPGDFSDAIAFHVNGDVGGVDHPVSQQTVAAGMEADFHTTDGVKPSFLYIVGDCVYFNGQLSEYQGQFYEPYQHYAGPIFAVPGNHDGENLPADMTLDGFIANFCAKKPTVTPAAGTQTRTAMTQPNVYWTLVTPLISIVGIYSNVPEGGDIRTPQTTWLVNELKTLPKNRPLAVALHHPVYSADIYHSGSSHMKDILENAFQQAGRHADLVLAGHVHDYQRFTKTLPDGGVVPYVVTGAGGYKNLHPIEKTSSGSPLVTPVSFIDKEGETVTLEKYADKQYGFLRLEVTKALITGRYFNCTEARLQTPAGEGNMLFDYFELDWKKRAYVPNSFGPKSS